MSSASTTTLEQVDGAEVQWTPSANPWVIAVSVMLATFMVVLDSSVANVALPHIAGNLSASTDESTWVLTSYLVSNAIMLPVTGWISRRIGRRRLLISSIVLFTAASLLCGVAVNLPMLIAARVLQGFGGGGMQPLVHAILLESFPHHQRGKAMAAYGVGVVVAPVIGPTLGGWITDSYSWRWIFYINLPVGLLALYMVSSFVEDPPYLRRRFRGAIDSLGFGLMALGLGALQLMLDKGQEADWFSAHLDLLDGRDCGAGAGRVRGPRVHHRGADRAVARPARSQLRRGHSDYHRLWGRALRRHGPAAAVPANAARLPRARERPGREPARHRLHGFDGRGGR